MKKAIFFIQKVETILNRIRKRALFGRNFWHLCMFPDLRNYIYGLAIAIFYTSLNVVWHQTFLMLIFYTCEFLSNFLKVTDMNYITHWCFFIYFYQPIHWYLTRILMFLSEQRALISIMFAWELSIMWYDHSIVTYKFQYSWHVWTSPVQGAIVTAVCRVCFDMIFEV